jgi:DNA polymerase-3 subunit gamma/tau
MDVIGQKHVVLPVLNSLGNNTYPQSVLFSGIHGTGKTTLARIVAMYLNCTESNKPCGICNSCVSILNKSNQDVIEVNAADHRGINDIRSIIDRAQYAPVGKSKVFILDEVHRLTIDAQNSLLKILEEPPNGVYFILATTEKEKLLPTILSRCQIHDLRRVDTPTIVKRLVKISESENKYLQNDVLMFIAEQAKGSVRDAITLLEKVFEQSEPDIESVKSLLGKAEDTLIQELIAFTIGNKPGEAFMVVQNLVESGTDFEQTVVGIENWLQQILFAKVGQTENNEAMNQSSIIPQSDIVRLFDCFTKWRTRFTPVQRMSIEVAIAEYCSEKEVAPPVKVVVPVTDQEKPKRPWEVAMEQTEQARPTEFSSSF